MSAYLRIPGSRIVIEFKDATSADQISDALRRGLMSSGKVIRFSDPQTELLVNLDQVGWLEITVDANLSVREGEHVIGSYLGALNV